MDRPLTCIWCEGSAIYVYGITPVGGPNPNDAADYIFSLDGGVFGDYVRDRVAPLVLQPSFVYDVLLFHSNNLSSGQHTLDMQNGILGGNPSLILFDYIVYTMYVHRPLTEMQF